MICKICSNIVLQSSTDQNLPTICGKEQGQHGNLILISGPKICCNVFGWSFRSYLYSNKYHKLFLLQFILTLEQVHRTRLSLNSHFLAPIAVSTSWRWPWYLIYIYFWILINLFLWWIFDVKTGNMKNSFTSIFIFYLATMIEGDATSMFTWI